MVSIGNGKKTCPKEVLSTTPHLTLELVTLCIAFLAILTFVSAFRISGEIECGWLVTAPVDDHFSLPFLLALKENQGKGGR